MITTRVLLRSEQSNHEVAIVENTVPAHWGGPPLHHHDFGEAFHVLEGELTFQVGDAVHTARPGAVAFAPRGVHHTLANHSDRPARYLLVITPGGFERYFDRMTDDPPATASKPFLETIVVGDQIPAGAPAPPLPIRKAGINVMLRGEQTGGVVSLMDNNVPADVKGPPLHHHGFDEAFYLVEGELTFQLEDRLVEVRAGELAFAPRHVPHTFTNRSGRPARFVIVCTPAGFERYFARMAAEKAGIDPPEWALGETPEVTMVGPQIGEQA